MALKLVKKESMIIDSEDLESGFSKSTTDKAINKITKKCGEVFIDNDDLFSFLCTLCEAPFEEVDKFLNHVKCTHENAKSSKNKNTVENQDNLELNDNGSDNIKCEPSNLICTVVHVNIESGLKQSTQLTDNSTADISITEQTTVRTRKKIYNFKVEESDEEYDSDLNENADNSSKTIPYNISSEDSVKINQNRKNKKLHLKNDLDEDYVPKEYNEQKDEDNPDNNDTMENPVCHICGRNFSTIKSWNRHCKTVNCADKAAQMKSYLCDICGKEFKSKRAVEEHKYFTKRGHNLRVDIQNSTDLAETNLSPRILKKLNESQLDENDGLKCTYCGKRLADSSKRADHERIHTGEKPFQCQICGKQFRTRGLILSHEKLHTAERLFKCEVCNLTFKTKGALYTHSQRHGEKKIQCSYCDKLFFQKSELREHERIHTGEKPFKCNFCGKCFQTSGSLNTHSRRHLNIRPHKCQYCDRSFFTKAMLRNHEVIHTGERPHACSICNATFPRRRGLKAHEKTHSEFHKFICRICDEPFKKYYGLYLHMRNHGVNLSEQSRPKD